MKPPGYFEAQTKVDTGERRPTRGYFFQELFCFVRYIVGVCSFRLEAREGR